MVLCLRSTPVESTEFSPTITPSRTVEPAPIKQLSSIMTGLACTGSSTPPITALLERCTLLTVGSCAQIGKSVHLSSNAVIGGVLEPVQANPVIIEDNCFIGAGSTVLEGVIVGENSVLSTGVLLSQST